MEPSSSFSKRKNNIDPVELYNYTHASYDELYQQEQFLKYEYIIISKGFLPEGNILDLGCGTGLLLDFLRQKKIKYKRIVCIDPSEKMLELAVYKAGNDPRVIFIQGYAEDLPFDSEVFDTIYMFTVWDNITNKEKAFQEEAPQEDMYQEAEHIETFEEELKEELEALKPQKKENDPESETAKYKAIPYIDQKFKNMHVQYPPVQETLEIFPSVTAWLLQISNEGYSEEEVEAIIKYIDSLAVEHKEEAAQLLLITAATESKYAKFRLARTLYKGEVLQKNLAESFTLINRLATNDDYPEAICDLAQFYEYGIGIDKDKKKAEALYEEAMNSGIKRASEHYERIKKQNRGLFSFLKK